MATAEPDAVVAATSAWTTLYTPVVGDVLDSLGFHHQFLPPALQAMVPGTKLVGRAMPVLIGDVFSAQRKPFGLLTEALDQLEPGEVYLCAGGAMRSAYWGEILTATAKARGAVGAVIDGYHRDTTKVLEQDWPVFSRGPFAQDSATRTRVIDFRVPVGVASVLVRPGDLVFGDLDGVLVIPREAEAEVLELATEKAQAENLVRAAIEAGMSATDAFAAYGVL